MKILLLADKPNWAYDSIAQSLLRYNVDTSVRLSIMYIKKNEHRIAKKYKKYDRILVMGWQTYERVKFLPKNITSVGVHSFHSWDKRKTTPERDATPPKRLIEYLSSFYSINAVSKRLTELFSKCGLKIVYTPNGVDTQLFRCTNLPPLDSNLVVGYSGSKAHDWRKGVSEFIIPAARKSGVKVKMAMLSTNSHVPLDIMCTFYNQLDCYVCASSSEGMSLSVLEAAACGRPVIGTKCSGNTEIIKDGKTGFLVNREVGEISDAINKLKEASVLTTMSDAIRKDVELNWCWSKRTKAWIDFLS